VAFYLSVVFATAVASPHLARDVRNAQDDGCSDVQKTIELTNSDYYDTDTDLFFQVVPNAACSGWRNQQGTNHTSGLFIVSPQGGCDYKVFCDMCLADGEGWIVFQRRLDDTEAFEDKNWEDYKLGFGNHYGNYWMGLERLHGITFSGTYDLFISFHKHIAPEKTYIAFYKNFKVDSETEFYKMTYGSYDGSRGLGDEVPTNSLSQHNGSNFTTRDRDNDRVENFNCAIWNPNTSNERLFGGWWFGNNSDSAHSDLEKCYKANLNGKYNVGANGDLNGTGIQWRADWDPKVWMSKTVMAIRRVT
jgi:hypothetical protein